MPLQVLVGPQGLQRGEMPSQGHLVVAIMHPVMALPTDVDASVEFLAAVLLRKPFAPVDLARDQVMQGQLDPAAA